MSATETATDYYEILQVSPSASPEVIEAAYKGLEKKYGSDKDPLVRQRRRDLEEAYTVLSNAAKRADYDGARNGSGSAEPAAQAPVRLGGATIVQCARHPDVETALRCSRCETPICPKCLIQTPVGARCKDCARIGKNPIYTLTTGAALKAAAASVIGGVVMGLIWGLVLMPFTFGFLSIFVGAGLGWVFTRLLEWVTRRKRGPYVIGFAITGIGIAWAMQLLFVPVQFALYGLVAAAVAVYFAYQSLR
jgi:hypothetical protein